MKYVFQVTERVFYDLTIESDDPREALRLAQESLFLGDFGKEVASEVDFDYNYDAMQNVIED